VGSSDLEGLGVVCVAVLAFAAFVGLVVALIVYTSRLAERRRAAVAAALKPYKGEVFAGDWLTPSWANFEMLEIPGRLSWHPGAKNQPPYTRVEFLLRSPGMLRVRREGFLGTLRKIFGGQDIRIGDARFDEEFQIEASPSRLASRLLTPEARRALLELHDPVLDVQRESARLTVHQCLPSDPAALERFVRQAEIILRALSGGDPGVEVLAVTSAPGACPTCGTAIEEAPAICAKCGGRQHRDCWSYVGGCATYACGCTRMIS
jgi:hypothetical protein